MLIEKQDEVRALKDILDCVFPRPKPDLAERLIVTFGSFRDVLAQSAEALEYAGATPALAHYLSCLDAFLLSAESPLKKGDKMKSFDDIYPFIRKMGFSTSEYCLVYFFDSRNIVVDVMLESSRHKGFVNLNRVFDHAQFMKRKYSYVIIAHNHPNGIAAPSQEDIDVTRNLKHVLSYRNAELKDHIISSQGEYYSFYEQGIL